MDYQDELEYKGVLVLLDPREREVFKAIQVHPDRSVLLDGQVINHRMLRVVCVCAENRLCLG